MYSIFNTWMKPAALCILWIGFFTPIQAQKIVLSHDAEVSLLTCSKGDDLYNTFGHSGIRIKDPANQLDIVFNYGMFSFGGSSWQDQAAFGFEFARGKLNYWLGVQEFPNFMYSYQKQERWVYEQVLNISHQEKEDLFNALLINYEPENRAYQYDFFFDNCSSRVRDMLVNSIGPIFGDANSPIHEKTDKSFIDLINPYIIGKPWLDLGMDILLGVHSSRKASHYEFMFLPYHLMNQIDAVEGLVASEQMIITAPDRPIGEAKFSFLSPFSVFTYLLIFIGAITYRNWKQGKHFFVIDRILFVITGLLGTLFLVMWLFTDHLAAHINLNMFWAFPLNLVAVFFLKNPKWEVYFRIAAGFCGFVLLGWFISPQQYHIAILPLTAIMLIRHIKCLSYHHKLTKLN